MKSPTLYDWFRSLSEKRQAIIREDKLANVAFDAGVAAPRAVEPPSGVTASMRDSLMAAVRQAAVARADADMAKAVAMGPAPKESAFVVLAGEALAAVNEAERLRVDYYKALREFSEFAGRK